MKTFHQRYFLKMRFFLSRTQNPSEKKNLIQWGKDHYNQYRKCYRGMMYAERRLNFLLREIARFARPTKRDHQDFLVESAQTSQTLDQLSQMLNVNSFLISSRIHYLLKERDELRKKMGKN